VRRTVRYAVFGVVRYAVSGAVRCAVFGVVRRAAHCVAGAGPSSSWY
jgi:hypothetical protein